MSVEQTTVLYRFATSIVFASVSPSVFFCLFFSIFCPVFRQCTLRSFLFAADTQKRGKESSGSLTTRRPLYRRVRESRELEPVQTMYSAEKVSSSGCFVPFKKEGKRGKIMLLFTQSRGHKREIRLLIVNFRSFHP